MEVFKIKNNVIENNKRAFFRISFDVPMCTDITIVEVAGHNVKVGTSKVCVLDIGIGGLAFISDLDFPIDRKVVYKFSTQLFGENVDFYGNIIRCNDHNDKKHKYGVQFICSQESENKYIQILNKLSISLRKNTSSCKYCLCNKNNCPCNIDKNMV